MRAAARALLPRLRGGHDVVVTLRPAAREADFQALQEGLRAVCRRAGLLNEEAQGRATVSRGRGAGGQS